MAQRQVDLSAYIPHIPADNQGHGPGPMQRGQLIVEMEEDDDHFTSEPQQVSYGFFSSF